MSVKVHHATIEDARFTNPEPPETGVIKESGMSKKKITRKKTATQKKVVRKKRVAALSEERTHKLTKPQLLKWRTLFAEMQSTGARVETSGLRLVEASRNFNNFVTTIPRAAELQKVVMDEASNLKALQQGHKERQKEHTLYVKSLCEKLGITKGNIAIDEQSGIVREIEQGAG